MDDDREGGGEAIPPAEAFSILGNETRIAILRTLWEAGEARSYAAIREDLDTEGRSNVNYHLDKLTGHFVRKTEDGYDLRYAGEQVIRAVVAGTFTEDPSLSPREIDERCAYCGGVVEMAYGEENISVRCTDCGGVVGGEFPPGTYMHYGFPPSGLAGRSREEVVDAAHVLYDSKVAPMMKGVCPECAGRVELDVEACADHDTDESGLCGTCDSRFEVWAHYECGNCRYDRRTAMWFAALNHPAVVAFYHDHGLEETIPFRKLTADNARLVRGISETVVGTDPYRFRVTIPVDGEELVVWMDEQLDVLDVERT